MFYKSRKKSDFLAAFSIFSEVFILSQITVSNLTFAYDGSYDNIFEDVSFQLDTDWKLGFIGRNGRGKTTFLNLLMGKYEYGGSISVSVEFDYFPFPVEDEEALTSDVAAQAAGHYYEDWQLYRELNLLGVEEDVPYRPFSTLSGGEKTKVLLAALFLKENAFLLIDEPTNHLDREGRELLARYLNGKKGFILVSHDRLFLDRCVDHVLSINRADIQVQKGNYSTWQANREMEEHYEQARNEKLKKDIVRLDRAAKEAAGWSDKVEKTKIGTRVAGLRPDRGHIGHQAAKMMKRSKSVEARRKKALSEKEELFRNTETAEDLRIHPLAYHSERLLAARGLTLFYDGTPVCGPVDFTLCRGDRISLSGKNGSGKTTLLKRALGENIDFQGELQVGSGLKVSYVSQDTSFLKGGLREFAEKEGVDESLFMAILRKLDFSRVQFEKSMENYSGGQKKKVLIAKSLSQKAHLYIWDEPLNFVDILSRVQIEDLILRYQPTMLFVEHDGAFQNSVATKKIEL